jgi:hypothetical protein
LRAVRQRSRAQGRTSVTILGVLIAFILSAMVFST